MLALMKGLKESWDLMRNLPLPTIKIKHLEREIA